MFQKGKIYRHRNPNATLDIKVLSVLDVNGDRTKMKVFYVTRNTKNLQYTGKGHTGYEDKIEIQSANYDDWKEIE